MQDLMFYVILIILFFIVLFIATSLIIFILRKTPLTFTCPKPVFSPDPNPTILLPSDSDLHQPTQDIDPDSILLSDTPSSELIGDDPNPSLESGQGEMDEDSSTSINNDDVDGDSSGSYTRPESGDSHPITTSSSSSGMQKKIEVQYDELVTCNQLTLSQVIQFANSLVDARIKLQHKADVTQRKFVITKALLSKADRSSYDRLRQQICKLESEQKRLEEDAFVYNWLQQQLKLYPAYNKMLEIGVSIEKEKIL